LDLMQCRYMENQLFEGHKCRDCYRPLQSTDPNTCKLQPYGNSTFFKTKYGLNGKCPVVGKPRLVCESCATFLQQHQLEVTELNFGEVYDILHTMPVHRPISSYNRR
jgi:hypothetical protein